MYKSGAFKIALIYLAISLLWIFLSDRILFFFKDNFTEHTFLMLNSIKGVFCVTSTSLLLYVLIRNGNRQIVKNEKGYRDQYECNPNPMWMYDPYTLQFISVNDSAVAVYGYSRDEFLKMTIKDIRPPEELDRLQQSINRSNILQRSQGWKHRKKDGTIMTVDVSSHRVILAGKEAVIALIIDSTEIIAHQELLNQVNTELTTEKKRLSDIHELSKIGGWDYYIDDGSLVLSDEMYKIFNIDKSVSMVDQSLFLKTIHRDDLNDFLNAADITLSQGTDLDIVHRFYLGKNDIRYIRQLGKMEYRDDKPYKIRGTMQDVTELKIMEHEKNMIHNENKKLDNIITKINNMVVILDADSRITWVNKAYEMFTGHLLANVKGSKPSSFMLGPDNIDELREVEKALQRLEAFTIDMINYTSQNQSYWVNIEFTPMFESGKFTGYITVHNNITTRKEKEEEITKQNIILRDIAWLSSHEIRRPAASILGLMQLINNEASEEERDEYLQLLNECTLQLDQIIHQINDTINEKLPYVE